MPLARARPAWQSRIHPDDRALMKRKIDDIIHRRTDVHDAEYRILHKDGHHIWLHSHGHPFRDQTGQPVRVTGLDFDVTERRRVEERTRELQRALARVSRVNTMGEMAASLAHELNQPLTAITNHAKGTLRRLETGKGNPGELPAMSGLQLQEALARRFSNPSVIVVTAHADVPMAVRAMKAGALDFIEKPFNDQELLELVQKAIERSAQTVGDRRDRRAIQHRYDSLSRREHQVLKRIVAGDSNKTIAADQAMAAGAMGYFEKPIDDKALLELVMKGIDKASNDQAGHPTTASSSHPGSPAPSCR